MAQGYTRARTAQHARSKHSADLTGRRYMLSFEREAIEVFCTGGWLGAGYVYCADGEVIGRV